MSKLVFFFVHLSSNSAWMCWLTKNAVRFAALFFLLLRLSERPWKGNHLFVEVVVCSSWLDKHGLPLNGCVNSQVTWWCPHKHKHICLWRQAKFSNQWHYTHWIWSFPITEEPNTWASTISDISDLDTPRLSACLHSLVMNIVMLFDITIFMTCWFEVLDLQTFRIIEDFKPTG